MEEPQKKGCKNFQNGCRTRSGLFVVEQDKLQSTNHSIFIAATRSAVLSEVLNGTNHLRGVGVLVVVPGHDLNLIGVVVDLSDHGLGSVEQRAVTHADDVGPCSLS